MPREDCLRATPRIAEKLQALGKNQAWLAQQTGRTRQQISDIIRGHTIPGVLLAFTIAAALQCHIEELWTVEERT